MEGLIRKEDVYDAIVEWADEEDAVPIAAGARKAAEIVANAPEVAAVEIVRCKNCRYFERDHFEKMDGFPVPLIVAHEICTKWGDGCKTRENGYCFMAEKSEAEE